MTVTVGREHRSPAPRITGANGAEFDEAFRSLLRAWHDYEVSKALGASLDDIATARGTLHRARSEVARRRQMLSR
jgi:hypothetical protein